MAKTAFIGLGVMGYPMAGCLTKNSHDVTVYNRTTSKAEKWAKQYQGNFENTPAKAAKDCDFVFACVGNDDDLRSVTLGEDGAFSTMKSSAVFVDHTTASASVAEELSLLAEAQGIGFVDAPISGGQAGAESGALTVMVGGEKSLFDRVKPIIDCYAKMVGHMGPIGSGQRAKMVNQICIAGIVQGLSEGIHFAQKAGLDVEHLIDVLSKGAAGSWQMENRHKSMNDADYNHGFAVEWMRKDLGIVLNEAKALSASLPLTALVDQFYGEVQDMGGNRWDTSSLLARLNRK